MQKHSIKQPCGKIHCTKSSLLAAPPPPQSNPNPLPTQPNPPPPHPHFYFCPAVPAHGQKPGVKQHLQKRTVRLVVSHQHPQQVHLQHQAPTEHTQRSLRNADIGVCWLPHHHNSHDVTDSDVGSVSYLDVTASVLLMPMQDWLPNDITASVLLMLVTVDDTKASVLLMWCRLPDDITVSVLLTRCRLSNGVTASVLLTWCRLSNGVTASVLLMWHRLSNGVTASVLLMVMWC